MEKFQVRENFHGADAVYILPENRPNPDFDNDLDFGDSFLTGTDFGNLGIACNFKGHLLSVEGLKT